MLYIGVLNMFYINLWWMIDGLPIDKCGLPIINKTTRRVITNNERSDRGMQETVIYDLIFESDEDFSGILL